MHKFIAKRFDLLVSLDWAAAHKGRLTGLKPGEVEPAWVLDESLSYWYGANLNPAPRLVKQLNAALQKTKNDSRYAQIKQGYLAKY